MIGHVLCGRTGLPHCELLNTRRLTAASKLPVMTWHHGGATLKSHATRHDALAFDNRMFDGKAVLFMMRDPRDTLVSAYFQASKRDRSYSDNIAAFVRSSERGIQKWIAYHNLWNAHRDRLRAFHLVRYESLQENPSLVLRDVLQAVGVRDADDTEISSAVEFTRFENLKRLEAVGSIRDSALRPNDRNDPDSYKVRKGEVGGYLDILSREDIGHIDNALELIPCPLYRAHYVDALKA